MARSETFTQPVGAHRTHPRGWTRIFVFLAVFALSGALAYAGATVAARTAGFDVGDLFGQGTTEPSQAPTPSQTATTEPSPTPSETVEHNYDFAASVGIYNLVGDSSISDDAKAALTGEGFTSVVTGNWSGTRPPANIVRFTNPALEDTAQFVASLLGIQTVASGDTGGPAIAVIYITDPNAEPEPSAAPSP